ncbi:NAD(P)H-dependent oxidoreductase [Paenirhodobacter sp.]|uniref:NAD(P)H-dependent oxidoreductase n=1 Tax=Paenirhodobacter sp. TaxID=1965326 RepID=UPI003B409675
MSDRQRGPNLQNEASGAGNVSRRNIFRAGAGLALGAVVPAALSGTSAQAQVINGTPKTLIIASHPYPDRSVVNKALWEVAQTAEDTMFVNLDSVYGDNVRGFDRAAERRLYQQMDRMVLMFPIHWFNMTPMMKAYLNEVWGAGAPSELRGKELFAVVTAGGAASGYRREGQYGFTIEQVLTPLAASANYIGMNYSEPLAFLGAAGASGSRLREYQDALAARLREAPRRG